MWNGFGHQALVCQVGYYLELCEWMVGSRCWRISSRKERLPRPFKERMEENERGASLFSTPEKNEESVSKVMRWWRTDEGSTEKYTHPAGCTHSQSWTYICAGREATRHRHTRKDTPQGKCFYMMTHLTVHKDMRAYMHTGMLKHTHTHTHTHTTHNTH